MPLSQADVFKLAQAVEHEGYPREGVAWALLQRYAWLVTQGVQTSLAKLVEQYAQPINPAWFPNGQKHRDEVARLERLGDYGGAEVEKLKAKNRLKKASTTWEELRPEVKRTVLDIFSGKVKSPVRGAVHYLASRAPDFAGNQAKKPNLILLDRGYGFGPGRNVFFGVKGAENFVASILPDGGVPGGPGIVLGLLLAGYFFFKVWGRA